MHREMVRDFNEKFGVAVDEILARNENIGKRPSVYRIPSEVIEFINAVGYAIHKPFAYPLKIYIHLHMPLFTKVSANVDDCLDWAYFMSDEIGVQQFYINCNPASRQYGNIIHVNFTHIYPSFCEFMKDLELWMRKSVEEPWADKDVRVQEFLNEYAYPRSSTLTNRDVLTNPLVLRYDEQTCINSAYYIAEELADAILFPNVYNVEFEECVIFGSWFHRRYFNYYKK